MRERKARRDLQAMEIRHSSHTKINNSWSSLSLGLEMKEKDLEHT